MPMQAHRGDGARLIVPNHPQPATRKMWAVSTTRKQMYALERPGTHCTADLVSLGSI